MEHLADLADRSRAKSIYTYSGFLSPEEQSRLLEHRRELSPFMLYGGADGTERNMARFGSENDLGYTEPFPIVCLISVPLNPRFADALTHRDVLGAVMNLGIERENVGDIVIRENACYLFCTRKLAPYLTENLTKIRHTDVRTEICQTLPEGELYQTEPMRLTVSSLRLDCVAGAAVKLSRSKISDLIREKKVFIGGAVCEKPDAILGEGNVFSVRGFGKFRLATLDGTSKKGKNVITVERYK